MINPNETQALLDLHRIANALGIPIMLIGAGARLLMLDWKYNIASYRTTEDWDLAVKVKSWDEFKRLREALLQGTKPVFRQSNITQRLIHTSGVQIDLVPFGELAKDGTIVWPDEQIEMTILGFEEAFVEARRIKLTLDVNISVVSVPSLVVLKLFAFSDRGDIADLRDIEFILKHYPQHESTKRIFDELATELATGEIDYEQAGPFLLGKDVGKLCAPKTRAQLLPVLDSLLDPYSAKIARLVDPIGDVDEEEKRRQAIVKLFKAFREGITSL